MMHNTYTLAEMVINLHIGYLTVLPFGQVI